jgi:4-hydroxy-tetrahydrodipicolinate synthase
MFGISAALTTPFTETGGVDFARLIAHTRTVLGEGCSSATLFGTTGEGASVASKQRLATVRAMIDGKIAPAALVLTLHGAAAGDIVEQAKAAIGMGVRRFLLPPPCYLNAPAMAGRAAGFASVRAPIQRSGARVILYHIPQVIGVGLPVELVARLKAAYPDLILGVKDSSGVFENTERLLELPGLEILIGDERLLAAAARLGAAGSISGIANLFSARLARELTSGDTDPGIDHLVDTVLRFPVTAAIKSLVAHRHGDAEWRRTCPPLEATPDRDRAALVAAYDAVVQG